MSLHRGKRAALFLLFIAVSSGGLHAAGPAPETVQAFNRYIRLTEMRLDANLQGDLRFLWAESPERRLRLRRGEVACEPHNGKGDVEVPGGLIHDWVGAVFIAGPGLDRVLALVRDYDSHSKIYRPEVVASKTLEHKGDDFKVHLRLLKRKAAVTVVLDTEHDVHYRRFGERAWFSRSRSTRIAEVGRARAGSQRPARDRGFLWRLNSYWVFREQDGGVYVECNAISLTRSVPQALEWLLEPVIRSLPRESLMNTLAATRSALGGSGPPAQALR